MRKAFMRLWGMVLAIVMCLSVTQAIMVKAEEEVALSGYTEDQLLAAFSGNWSGFLGHEAELTKNHIKATKEEYDTSLGQRVEVVVDTDWTYEGIVELVCIVDYYDKSPDQKTKALKFTGGEKNTEIPADDYLYNAEYYEKANEDVAVALNYDKAALYQHWLTYGKAEGRNASMVFNAKYYLEVNPSVAAEVGNDYVAAYEHFVNEGLQAGLESSPVFSVKYYLEANTDVAEAFNGDYVSAAKHFNENAIAEGRSGSGNFDYTVYRACNTDVEELYGDYTEGYYIHYINHGRAEGRTGGLGGSGTSSGIDTTTPSYRIFDAEYYLDRYPSLETEVGTDPDTLYKYWIEEGIAQGQTASPVIVPEEYLELNQDVAEVFGDDYAAAINHFLTNGILEGRTGSKEFDYSIYAACNTDVGGVFDDDIVGYYFHYVKYGKAENRTAAVYVPEEQPSVPDTVTVSDTEGRRYELVFNEAGKLVEQSCYSSEGTLLNKNTITYASDIEMLCQDSTGTAQAYRKQSFNPAGKLKEIDENNKTQITFYYAQVTEINPDGSVSCEFGVLEPHKQIISTYSVSTGERGYYHVYEYNADGLVKKYTYYLPSGIIYLYELYEYDAEGNRIKEEAYDTDESLMYYDTYEYNSYGNVTKWSRYDENDNLENYSESEYDVTGALLLKKSWYDALRRLMEYTLWEYSENGYKTLAYDADGILGVEREYDNEENLLQATFFEYTKGKLDSYCVRRYNENGKLYCETNYDADGNVISEIIY